MPDETRTPRFYTVPISREMAEQWADWRPLSELADSMRIKSYPDGTAMMFLRWEEDHDAR